MDLTVMMQEIRLLLGEYESLIRMFAIGSLAFFLLTPVLAPAAIVLMPADSLVRRKPRLQDRQPAAAAVYLILHFVKNLLGLALVLLGFLLLFMPGQGLLTIFIGVLLTDLPGRRILVTRLLGSGKIRPVVDRLREKYGRAPLQWPAGTDAGSSDSG